MTSCNSTNNIDILPIRNKLTAALGEHKSLYFQQMKDWFRGKLTKEEFDAAARKLLASSVVHLHNEFFVAILTKCQIFQTNPTPSQDIIHSTSESKSSLYNVEIPTNNGSVTSSDFFGDSLNSGGSFNNNCTPTTSSSTMTNKGSDMPPLDNNTIFNNLLNSSCNPHFTNSLGTKTNAITINNTSGISFKVEVPMHTLESINSNLSSMQPHADKKKTNKNNNKKKQKTVETLTENAFESVNIHTLAPIAQTRDPHALKDARAGHHTRAHCLLGLPELRGRVLLAAWDHGLNAATENVVKLLHQATKQILLNVITSVLKSRGGFKVREGRFVHSIGTNPPNPWLRSASSATDWTADSIGSCGDGHSPGDRPYLWPTEEAALQNGAHLMSYSTREPPPNGPINCFDLYTTLKVCPNSIPCHTVYSLCMERLSALLSHADHDSLAQEEVVRQEQKYRQQLRQYRLASGV